MLFRSLREGFRVHPEHSPAKVVLARIHLDMGNRAPALGVLREVVAADAQNLAAASLLARLLVEDHLTVEAAPLLQRLRMANHPDAAMSQPVEVVPEPIPEETETIPRGADPFDVPLLAERFASRGCYSAAVSLLGRICAENPDSDAARARLDALRAGLTGIGDLGEAQMVAGLRSPLPGRLDLEAALVEEERQRSPPRPTGVVGRWGRSFWGVT